MARAELETAAFNLRYALIVAPAGGVTVTVFAFQVAGDKITHIWAIRNPDKLRPWTTG